MRIYFLRHAKSQSRATWFEDDGLRPLTEEGVRLMGRQAVYLRKMGPTPEFIVTSPLVRAQQTAAIVAQEFGSDSVLVEDGRLAPGFNRERLVEIIDAYAGAESLMIVGHEPDFSATVTQVIGGGRVQFKKGGLARVDIVERVGDLVYGVLVSLLTPSHMTGA